MSITVVVRGGGRQVAAPSGYDNNCQVAVVVSNT